jgi:hypothetical protein
MAENETLAGAPIETSSQVRYWMNEIASAKKREKDYRKEGDRVLAIYGGKKKDQTPFNILYSNTETLLPALYGAVPRPVVQRRFKDADPIGKLSAQAAMRGLEYFMDTNMEEYASFNAVMEDAVVDALLPGRGITRLKYEPVLEGVETQVKTYEAVCPESVVWNRVFFGYCKKWSKLPWLAFEHHMTKLTASKLFTKDVVAKMVFTKAQPDDDEERAERSLDVNTSESTEVKTCEVYEVWDRDGDKKVRFVSPAYREDYLKVDDDPLGLTGFFPVPEPLRFLKKANDQIPVAIYCLYENQAKELNKITTRINRIIDSLKVRGAYDSTIEELEAIMKSDDNTLVPATNVAALQDAKGLDHAVWLMPIEKIVVVLQQLIIARQQCKQVIYEITGISDILRGQSVASETATAQEIKNQWGTLRLKRMQRDVQRYARDVLRIALEIMGRHFSEKTFAGMTGLPFVPTEKKEQAQAMLQIAQQLGMPPDPQSAQIAQQPSWGEVLGLLRDNQQRAYRIDIETNSTVDLEATEDQKNITEALTAISQYLQGVTPLVVAGSMPFQAAQAVLLAIVRRFRFGVEIEDHIAQMKQPTPPDQADKQAEQAKMQVEQQKAQADLQLKKIDAQVKQAEASARMKEIALEAEMKEREHQIKMEELAQKAEFGKLMAQIKQMEASAKIAVIEAQAKAAKEKPRATV